MASRTPRKPGLASGLPPEAGHGTSPGMTDILQTQEERYRALIEDVADGYYEVDLRGNFTFFNDALCRIFGYPREQILNRSHSDFMDAENARIAYEAFNRIFLTGGDVADITWEIIRPDSERRFLEISARLIIGADGRKTGFRGIARDITDRHLAQQALREPR